MADHGPSAELNHPFYYPETPQKSWKNFMTVIMDAVREGTITAYDPTRDDQFLVPLTYQEIEKKFKQNRYCTNHGSEQSTKNYKI